MADHRVGPEAVRMLMVRRLIETPACRRYVQIDIHDFMMGERELAQKYGVPWHSDAAVVTILAAGMTVLFAGYTLLASMIGKGT